jgi:hypothetical protein
VRGCARGRVAPARSLREAGSPSPGAGARKGHGGNGEARSDTIPGRMEPERFRFREDVLRAAAARTRRRLLATVCLAGAATVALWAAVLRAHGARPGTLLFALALLAVLAVLSLRRRLGRLHARWSSFEVRVDADAIAREVSGFPPARIARAEVAGVEERPAGLVVRDRAGRALLVPRELDGYERVRELLRGWSA